MAAGLGFKTFNTGDVLLASEVNGYLMQGILVFASAAARDAAITSPQEGQACYLKDTNSVLTYSGSAWVALGGAAGKLLQIVQGTTTTATTLATTSQTDTAITATITPTSATSTILVMASSNVRLFKGDTGGGDNQQNVRYTLLRGASVISGSDTNSAMRVVHRGHTNDEVEGIMYFTTTFRDSPATTSATTYKIQASASSTSNSGSIIFQANSGLGQITLLEIGA